MKAISLSQTAKWTLIAHCEIFSSLSSEKILQLIDSFSEIRFKPGQIIVQEGGPGDTLFLLAAGAVATLKDMGGGQRELLQIKPGDCFGEIAVITQSTRSATIKALSDTTCLAIKADDFYRLLENEPRLARSLLAMLSKRLKSSEQIASHHILNAYESLIFSLSDLTESRDPETGSHLNRVRDYCIFLAQEAAGRDCFEGRITPSFFECIAIASPLHDIGKVAIPDCILLKPGKLTAAEFEVMKTHTWLGASSMLKVVEHCDYPAFTMGYNIIHYHHERYDGKGYPAGLTGKAIPLEARIMALADVYDALLSKRPYKEPFTYEETWRIIEQEKGRQFDPDLVEVAIKRSSEFNNMHAHCLD